MVFAVWNTVVVIIDVVNSWLLEAQCHLTAVPNSLVEAVIISIFIISIIIIINAVNP
jgi:hypothetical protein